MTIYHTTLSAGRWQLLTLAEQLGNIGSEVSRARNAQKRSDVEGFQYAFDRVLELFDLTLTDLRWRGRLKEIARAREVVCDAFLGGGAFDSTLDDLMPYFDQFAYAARRNM